MCVLELGANSPNYIFLVKCGKTTIEAVWAINAPHNNEEKEEEKKANGVLVLCIQKEGKYARRNERERNIREESACFPKKKDEHRVGCHSNLEDMCVFVSFFCIYA